MRSSKGLTENDAKICKTAAFRGHVSIWASISVAVAILAAAVACGTGPCGLDAASPEQAVRTHIAAAQAGDVAALRRGACGPLADAMQTRSDAEVRDEFRRTYNPAPDHFTTSADQHTVTGYYTGISDLEISFITADHDGWKVCEIRRGNVVFGRLPGPFER